MSKRSNTSSKTINPSGFSFTIKHKAPPSGSGMSVHRLDLSKPIIKFKAKSANTSSKTGGRKTRKHIRKKTHNKKVKKTYKNKLSRKHKKK